MIQNNQSCYEPDDERGFEEVFEPYPPFLHEITKASLLKVFGSPGSYVRIVLHNLESAKETTQGMFLMAKMMKKNIAVYFGEKDDFSSPYAFVTTRGLIFLQQKF